MNHSLRLFFQRYHRLEVFKKHNVPTLVNQTNKLIELSLRQLKEENIDGIEYLNSIQGQIDYLETIQSDEQKQNIYRKCGCCSNYQFTHDLNCKLFDELIVNCKQFNNCEQNIDFRLMNAEERCSKCDNYQKDEIFDFAIGKCKKLLDLLNTNCKGFIEKKNI